MRRHRPLSKEARIVEALVADARRVGMAQVDAMAMRYGTAGREQHIATVMGGPTFGYRLGPVWDAFVAALAAPAEVGGQR